MTLYILAKYSLSERKYLSFNVIKYHIKLETLSKLNNNAYQKNTLLFISF